MGSIPVGVTRFESFERNCVRGFSCFFSRKETKTDGGITIFTQTVKNIALNFHTNDTVFSPAAIDAGTLLMLASVEFSAADKVLDLGCGYGVVGILAAKKIGADKVLMCDVSQDAVRLSTLNAAENGVEDVEIVQSDGFSDITKGDFTIILSNPPYHTDFSVAKGFIENGFRRLVVGGKMVMVTKRLEWYKNKFRAIFGGAKVETADGYYVFTAEKRATARKTPIKAKHTLSKKLQRKYAKRA